jgi:hypothetical protein
VTAEELKTRIEGEIAGDWIRTNAHGCDLKRCLVDPVQLPFEDVVNPLATLNLWLVLEEDPDTREGYKIVYDDKSDMFGLAWRLVSGRDGYLGAYGETFLEAFDAM